MPGTFVGGSIDIHVRFEALGGNARRAQISRRHEDLQRAYKHQVKTFARETRHVTSKLSRIQSEYLTRMKAIQKLEPQTYPEEWPPVEERRAIAAQMQDGPPLLTGASLPKLGPSSKNKDNGPKRPAAQNNGNRTMSLKTNSSSSKMNGMLGKPHWSHPSTQSVPTQKAKVETTAQADSTVSQEHPGTHQTSPHEQHPPVIVLSHSEPQNQAQHSSFSTSHPSVSPRSTQTTTSLHQPVASSSRVTLNVQSSNHVPRRRRRARLPWAKQENVLLFKVEGREGKETYTQVAQRKYPSIVL